MILNYLDFLNEKKTPSYEYQVRDIDDKVYYKRKKGTKKWLFINKKEFESNITKDNVIAWLPSIKNI